MVKGNSKAPLPSIDVKSRMEDDKWVLFTVSTAGESRVSHETSLVSGVVNGQVSFPSQVSAKIAAGKVEKFINNSRI